MDAIKIKHKIESDDLHIDGLSKYKGHEAEIIVLVEGYTEPQDDDSMKKAFDVIDSYTGTVKRWNRSELYER